MKAVIVKAAMAICFVMIVLFYFLFLINCPLLNNTNLRRP